MKRTFLSARAGFLIALVFACGSVLSTTARAATNPAVWLKQKVVASDGAAFEQFGWAVDVSGDTAMIGSPNAKVSGEALGAVYVYTRVEGKWTASQKLVAKDGLAGDWFGGRVAIRGSTAFIAANTATVNGNADQGAVYVFKRQDDGSWTQTAKLIAADGGAGDDFGFALATLDHRVLIGAPLASVNDNDNQGAVYVFSDAASTGDWEQVAKLTAADGGLGDEFGESLDAQGDLLVVGALFAPINGVKGQGAVYEFTYSDADGGWSQTEKITSDNVATNNEFGTAVAISGATLLVSAIGVAVDGNTLQGAAYIFDNGAGDWVQSQELTASDGLGRDTFGYSVALDGDRLMVAAPFAVVDQLLSQGAVYLYEKSAGVWEQTQKFAAHEGAASSFFGWATVLTNDLFLTGAVGTPVGQNSFQGAAYFYGLTDLSLAVSAPRHAAPGAELVSQILVTNVASAASPAVVMTTAVPAAASFVSANATQGECGFDADVVRCDFGAIPGNAGMATANVTLRVSGEHGSTIRNTASIVHAVPPLTASAVTAIAENNPPEASDGTLTTDENEATTGTLKATDSDGDPLVFSIVSPPVHGTVTLSDVASGAYTYMPDEGYSGTDSFTFKASDNEADSNVAEVTVTVTEKTAHASDGGGGAFGWLVLASLFALALGVLRLNDWRG